MPDSDFDFGRANANQKMAITCIDGPLLITAGPGTGKTLTLVKRAAYLIHKGVKPNQILLATFTEKAASELITRITNEFAKNPVPININEMYIGTFHSICLRLIKEHLEYTSFSHNYRILDKFDQQYTVLQNFNKFDNKDLNFILGDKDRHYLTWYEAGTICNYVNKLSEEQVEAKYLIDDEDPSIAASGRLLSAYQSILLEENLIDFATIQTECYGLLSNPNNHQLLEKLQNQIRYLMVDEYQDTNYIQEQIVFLLGGKLKNICVVGDDDQGLYRFRGATIQNILEFQKKFLNCKVVSLNENYRSRPDIVNFYNKWMSTTSSWVVKGSKQPLSWGNYRISKKIEPKRRPINSPTVIKLASKDDEKRWHESVLAFINKLMKSGKASDLNQIAFLFSSVKADCAKALANFLENNGIPVYSPRSALFFQRSEIKLAIGCLLLIFSKTYSLDSGKNKKAVHKYYSDCIKEATRLLDNPEYTELSGHIKESGETINALVLASRSKKLSYENNLEYAYSGLLYRLFTFKPFSNTLSSTETGVRAERDIRNLATLTQIFGKFEFIYKVDVLTGTNVCSNTKVLFNTYLRLLFDGGINEYEDDTEYAPSGCVSFLTIHQSKGMEFPIVFVDSLYDVPKKQTAAEVMRKICLQYTRTPIEPEKNIKFFDFWRKYYTAFSRAEDLLVLTCNQKEKKRKIPSKYFSEVYGRLPDANSSEFDLDAFDKFREVRKADIKKIFSFTSHIAVYETCPLQYKFFKELGFNPVRKGAMVFGRLVHETIEDIHRTVLRGDADKISDDYVKELLHRNYSSLEKAEHCFLDDDRIHSAENQVLQYVYKRSNNWDVIEKAEVDVMHVPEGKNYIIQGKIDLIQGKNGTIEIVDFKGEAKPKKNENARQQHYKQQLQLYAYLVEQQTNRSVSNLHLYYTSETESPWDSISYDKTDIKDTFDFFDSTVNNILKRKFPRKRDEKTCNECDFRFYCKNPTVKD